MSKIRRATQLLLALAVMSLAHAEKADSYQAMTIDADQVSVDEVRRTSVFTGHVVINQGSLQVKADKVIYRQSKDGESYSITAQGSPISFRQKQDNSPDYIEAYAQQLEFDSQAEQARLMRKALLRRGKDEVRGDTIFYDMRTQQYEVKGGTRTDEPSSGRVTVTIQPRRQAPPAAAPGEAAAPGVAP